MRIPTITAAALAVAVSIQEAPAQDASADLIATSFEVAMRDMLAGNPELAIPLLRGILGRDPDLVRVRLELARAYFEAGEFSEARRQFQIVLSSAEIPPSVRENVLRFLRRIDEDRGLQTDLSIALAAPTGSGRSYDTDTVNLDILGPTLPYDLNRPQVPDTALQVEGGIRKQWRLGSEHLGGRSSAYLRGNARLQEAEGLAFDQQEIEVGGGVQFTWPRKTVFAEVIGGATGVAGHLFETSSGVGLGYQARTAKGQVFFVTGSIEDVNFTDSTAQDGRLVSLGAGVSRPFRAVGTLRFSLDTDVFDAEREDFDYTGVEARLSHEIDISGGFSLTSSAFIETFDQGAASPGYLEAREEIEYGVDFRGDKTDVFLGGRYSPYVEFGLARRDSSIDAFSYDDVSIEAGLSSAF